MKITRDVIDDLLSAYFSGEASADTRSLVEEFFQQDPAYEEQTRSAAQVLQSIGEVPASSVDSAIEKAALNRAKRILNWQKILFAIGATLSLNAITLGISFNSDGGRLRVQWLTLPWQLPTVVVIALISAGFWAAYFLTSRRVRTHILD